MNKGLTGVCLYNTKTMLELRGLIFQAVLLLFGICVANWVRTDNYPVLYNLLIPGTTRIIPLNVHCRWADLQPYFSKYGSVKPICSISDCVVTVRIRVVRKTEDWKSDVFHEIRKNIFQVHSLLNEQRLESTVILSLESSNAGRGLGRGAAPSPQKIQNSKLIHFL